MLLSFKNVQNLNEVVLAVFLQLVSKLTEGINRWVKSQSVILNVFKGFISCLKSILQSDGGQ